MQLLTPRILPAIRVQPDIDARAAALDRVADLELQHGHTLAAERLATLAAELRAEAAR